MPAGNHKNRCVTETALDSLESPNQSDSDSSITHRTRSIKSYYSACRHPGLKCTPEVCDCVNCEKYCQCSSSC